jgi:putative ABC transport system permease protein
VLSRQIKPNILKPRRKKVLIDLWDSKMRTFLVVASIAVGVFAIGMIVSAYIIMAEDINVSYIAVNPVNVEVWTDPFYKDYVDVIEKLPGVNEVEGQHVINIRSREEGGFWQGVTLIAKEDFESTEINLITLVDGVLHPGKNEVVISEDMMSTTGYQVGDEIEIELPDASRHTVTVVGLAIDLATGGGPDPQSGANMYIQLDTLDRLGMGDHFNRLLATVEGDGGDMDYINEVADTIEDKLERTFRGVYRTETNLSTENPMASTILAVLGVLGVLGGLITVLSSSLIINTLNALLAQHLRQIGVMKLVGGRSSQIMGMYLSLIFAYGLISLVFTIPLGAIAGYQFANYLATTMGASLQGFRIIPIAIISQVLVSFLVPLGAGYFPVNKGAKINVRRAISSDRTGSQPTRLDFFNRFITSIILTVQWVSRPILLSFRNTFQKKGRLMLTIFTLTIAGSVFIAVFNVRSSMLNFMDQLMQYFMGDITVTFSRPYRIDSVEDALLPVQGVEDLEAWGGAFGEIWDKNDEVVVNISIIAPPEDTFLLNPDIVAGRWILPGEQNTLVVSDSIYDWYPDLQPGDNLTIKIDGIREAEWKVVGVFRFVSMLGDPIAYANFEHIARLITLPDQAVSYRLITERHDIDTQIALSLAIDEYLIDRGFAVSSVESGELVQQDSTRGINIIVIFLLVMAVLTAFVGSIGLTGTMGMNVLDRTREIGVMRAIGAVDFVVIKSIVIEALTIGLITWVLAIGLSFPISEFLLDIIAEAMMGSEMVLTYTPLGVIIWLGVVVLLSLVASILPARNAARLTIREVLAYEG